MRFALSRTPQVIALLLILNFSAGCGKKDAPVPAPVVIAPQTTKQATPSETKDTASPTNTKEPGEAPPQASSKETGIAPGKSKESATANAGEPKTESPAKDSIPLAIGEPVKAAEEVPEYEKGQGIFLMPRGTFGAKSHSKKAIAFSPDGRWIASVGSGPMLTLWDASTGQIRREVPLHQIVGNDHLYMEFVAFSPDGKLIVAPSVKGKVLLFDTATLQLKAGIQEADPRAAAFSPDGKMLAVFSNQFGKPGTVRLWNTENAKEIALLPGIGEFSLKTTLAFSPDGKTIAVSGSMNEVLLLSAKPLAVRARLSGHKQAVTGLAFSPDGAHLATIASNEAIKIWDVKSGAEKRSIPNREFSAVVRFSPGGNYLAVGATTLQLFRTDTGAPLASFSGIRTWIDSLAFSPDGNTLALAGNNTRELTLVDIRVGRWRHLEDKQATAAVGSPDGKWIAIMHNDRIDIRDALTGKVSQSISNVGNGTGLAFSRNSSEAIFGSQDRKLVVYDLNAKKEKLQLDTNIFGVGRVALSQDEKLIAVSNANSLALVSRDKPDPAKVWNQGGESISALAFAPNGKTIITGGDNGMLRFWDVAMWKPRLSVQAHEGAISMFDISPDGSRAASTGGLMDPRIRIWEIGSGKLVQTIAAGHRDLHGVCFTPDGLQVSATSEGKTFHVWEVKSGKEVHVAALRDEPVGDTFMSPDRKTLIAVHFESIHLWDIASLRRPLPEISKIFRVPAMAASVPPAVYNSVRKVQKFANFSPKYLRFVMGGQRLALVDANLVVKVIDTVTGKTMASFAPPFQQNFDAGSISFSPDGKLAAFGLQDNSIHLWDLQASKEKLVLKGHSVAPRSLAFSPDSRKLISVSGWLNKGELLVWDLESGAPKKLADGEMGSKLVFSSDGSMFAFGSNDGTIHVWDAKKLSEIRSFEAPRSIATLAFSSDGKTLAVARSSPGESADVTLWDPISGVRKAMVPGRDRNVVSLAFTPSGLLIVTEFVSFLDSNTSGVKIWKGEQLVREIGFKEPCGLSADGNALVCAGPMLETLYWLDLNDLLDDRLQAVLSPVAEQNAVIEYDSGTYRITLGVNGDLSGGCLSSLKKLDRPHSLNLQQSPSLTDDNLAGVAGDQSLKGLEIQFGNMLTDAGFKHLATFTGLETLSVTDSPLTDAGLAGIAKLPKLAALNLQGTKITPAGVAKLKDCKSLKSLSLRNVPLTAEALDQLAGLPNLESLDLAGCNLQAMDLTHLKPLTKLKTLLLVGGAGDESVAKIAETLPKLEVLDIEGADLTNADLKHFKALQSLVRLSIGNGFGEVKITAEGLNELKALPKLTSLVLKGKMPVKELSALKSMKQLKELTIVDEEFGDDEFSILQELPQLENLEVSSQKITDKGLKKLAEFKPLRHVKIQSFNITPDAREALIKARPDIVVE